MKPPAPTPIPPAPPAPSDLAASYQRDPNGLPLGLPMPLDFLTICASIRARVATERAQHAA
jgi:hypothetical protein